MNFVPSMKVIFGLSILGLLVACAETLLETPGLSYTKSAPLLLKTEDIQVVSIPESHPSKNKYVQEEADKLRSEMSNWAHSRFKAQGGEHRAVILMNKVTLKVFKDKKSEDMNIRRDIYVGTIDLKLEIQDMQGKTKGMVSASVKQSLGIPDSLTYHERENRLQRLKEELVNAVDAKIVKEISENLLPYVISF